MMANETKLFSHMNLNKKNYMSKEWKLKKSGIYSELIYFKG